MKIQRAAASLRLQEQAAGRQHTELHLALCSQALHSARWLLALGGLRLTLHERGTGPSTVYGELAYLPSGPELFFPDERLALRFAPGGQVLAARAVRLGDGIRYGEFQVITRFAQLAELSETLGAPVSSPHRLVYAEPESHSHRSTSH